MTLPPGVTAVLVDVEPARSGSGPTHTYHLADKRGYTHRYDTVRVRPFRDYGTAAYRVETHHPTGWHELTAGTIAADEPVPYDAAVARAVAILYRA